jgi:NitT/TauT family transport system permease protein
VFSGAVRELTGFLAGRLGQLASRAASIVLLVVLWWLGAKLAHDPGRFPAPGAVLDFAWGALVAGEMGPAIGATLARVMVAFALSMAAGVAIGVVAGRSRAADALIDPWLVLALNLPVLMVVVLVYVWLGLNEAAAILAVCIAKIPSVAVTMREGARALDPALDELALGFAVPPWRRVTKIVLPQLAPYLAAAARAGLSITWKIVLIVELIGRPNGVGFELNFAFQNFDVAGIVAYGLSFALIMLGAEILLLQPLERRANAWR